MAETVPEFGRLLTIGIKAIAAREQKNISVIQDELGHAFNRSGGPAIEYWRKGYVPDYDILEALANLCVKRGNLDKGWLSDFLQSTRHPDRGRIIETLFGNQTNQAKQLRHNLPRRDYVEFIGRQHDLERIATWLHPNDRAWLLTIDGVGGIGKSALVLESAYRLLEGRPPFVAPYPYEAIVWVSAKQEFLTLDGKIPSVDYFQTLADIYTAIADVLQREDIIRSQPKDQNRLVRRILSEQAVLLIVDNLETVADKTIYAFLRQDLPQPSKAMITTRERIDVAQKLRVSALSKTEGLRLIKRAKLATGISLTEEQQEKIFRRTGGIPLVITLTIARIATGYSVESVLADLGKVQKDLVSYCLQSSIDSLHSSEAQQTLLALSIFAVDAGQQALKFVAGFEKDPLSYEEALAHLEQLSLIDERDEAQGKRYTMLPITRAFAHQILAKESDLKQEMLERQIQHYLDTLAAIGYDYTPENWEKLDDIGKEQENLFGIMTFLEENQRRQQLIQFVAYLYGYLSFHGHWSDYLQWVERAEAAAKALQDTDQFEPEIQKALGWCLSEKCWIQINLGQFKEAQNTGTQAVDLFCQTKEQNGEAQALRHLGLIEKRLRNFEKSKEYYAKALDIWQTLRNEREVASIYNNLGSLALEEEKYAEAEVLLLKSLKMKENIGDVPRLGNTLYYLGELHFYQANLQQAKNYFLKTVEVANSCGDILYQARANLYLTKIAARLGDAQAAFQSAQHSLQSFQHLGMEAESQDVTNLLSEIQRM